MLQSIVTSSGSQPELAHRTRQGGIAVANHRGFV